jgi:cytochrome b561
MNRFLIFRERANTMSWKNTSTSYSSLSICLHWLMVLLIIAVYCLMEFKGITRKGSPGRDAMMGWHYMIGLLVFFLAWLRLAARLAGTRPVTEPAPPAWLSAIATSGHWTLYALMIGLPLLGWLTLSAKGEPVPFFGVDLPPLTGKDAAAAKTLKYLHETLARVGYFFLGAHAIAALFHHYLLRDNTLRLMLPRRNRSGESGARSG